jgi:hypothetical protein
MESETLDVWDEITAAMSRGEVKTVIEVDVRRRYRPKHGSRVGDATHEAVALSYAMSVASLIWPPMPEPGNPFQEGKEWTVDEMDNWIVDDDMPVRCKSVRVWPSGHAEIILKADRHIRPPEAFMEGPHRPMTRIPEFWQKWQWILKGNPPGVYEATKHQRSEAPGRTRTEEQTIRLISGHLPVRP